MKERLLVPWLVAVTWLAVVVTCAGQRMPTLKGKTFGNPTTTTSNSSTHQG